MILERGVAPGRTCCDYPVCKGRPLSVILPSPEPLAMCLKERNTWGSNSSYSVPFQTSRDGRFRAALWTVKVENDGRIDEVVAGH